MKDEIRLNQINIIETIKLLIYKDNTDLLEKVDFEDEDVFLEPLFFAYFNSKKKKLFSSHLLDEIIQGYFINKQELKNDYSFNKNGISYFPNLGYFKKGYSTPYDSILKIDEFEILKEIHPVLEPYFIQIYKGHIVNSNPKHISVWKDNYEELLKAINIIKIYLPDYYKDLIFANRKIYLHDNPEILNFTTVETLGMLYFYVLGNNNLIYYIEELIHQGSHNFFYYVIHNRKDYFKIDVDNLLMRDYTDQAWDYRNIYGAFHGLYTVTKRVECFDILLSTNVFKDKEKHELLGRLTDQFGRFRTGLELLNFEEVFTKKGESYYNELDKRCSKILNKYNKLLLEFDVSSVDLDFRYEDFCILNTIEDFQIKEAQGFFKF